MSEEKTKCSHRDKVTKLCKISISSDGTIGVHLSRTPWDPYPWVRGVQPNSGASIAGVHDGDVVLEVNGHDILGQRISELANIVRTHWGNGGTTVDFLVWRNRMDQKIMNQQSLQKYASCLQSIAQLLECPICLEVVKPPGWQCCNGHVLCNSCRGRTHKCPVCRVSLGPRGRCLLSDKLFTLLVESFPCDVKKNDNEIACHEQTLMTGSCTATSVSHPVSGMLSANPSNPKSENEHGRVFKKTIEVKLSQTKTNSTYSINDKIYHCPTGKSCAENGVTESCKLYNQWSILTHLQRHHDMPVNQYYGSYGELIPIELTDNSISGLTLKLEPSSHQSFPLENGKEFEQNLFFIVKIPLSDIEGDDYRSNVSTCSTSSSSISRSSSQDSCCSYRSNSQGNVSERSPATFSGSFFRNTTSIHSNGGNPISTDVLSTAKASTDTDNKKYAIFVWYCGNDEDVQKFRTKIECLYPKLKWKGKIHPLTENWNSIKRKKEFLVVNGDTFKYFEIVIKMK